MPLQLPERIDWLRPDAEPPFRSVVPSDELIDRWRERFPKKYDDLFNEAAPFSPEICEMIQHESSSAALQKMNDQTVGAAMRIAWQAELVRHRDRMIADLKDDAFAPDPFEPDRFDGRDYNEQ